MTERISLTHCLATAWKCESRSVVSDSLQPHGLYRPRDSPGQNTGVGSHSLLQRIFPTQRLNPGRPHYRQILYLLSHQGSPLNPGPLHWELRVLATGPPRKPLFFSFLKCRHRRVFCRVWSLIGELRFRKPHGTANNNILSALLELNEILDKKSFCKIYKLYKVYISLHMLVSSSR